MQRNLSIDFIKGLAITGVVMGHTCAFLWASPFFNLWHMAAFFIIGGWFFNEKYWNGIDNVDCFVGKRSKDFGGLSFFGVHFSSSFIILFIKFMCFPTTRTWCGNGCRRITIGCGHFGTYS